MASSAVPALHPVLQGVTARIEARSRATREAYLERLTRLSQRQRGSDRMGCANVAHAFAAMPAGDKLRIVEQRLPHLGVVSAYNDMLSAHQPYEGYPAQIRATAARLGATVQVAGGVPAMCDGVTQGLPGMELSLFSRDTIAMGTAIALSHDVFDGVLMLGICDKIVPGLLIGAHCTSAICRPCSCPPDRWLPAWPTTTRPRCASSTRRARWGARNCSRPSRRPTMARAPAPSTAPPIQQPDPARGHGPARAGRGLRAPARRCTAQCAHATRPWRLALQRTRGQGADFLPIGRLIDERVIVNAMVALLATGGSTNHLIHWVAVARAAGILIDWSDFAELSAAVPLLARVYPNGDADVNQFQSAGGPGFVLRELLAAGLMHATPAMSPEGLAAHTREPGMDGERLVWRDLPAQPVEPAIVRSVAEPFSPSGGLKLLDGNLGRAVIKTSAVPEERHIVEAPARIFATQEAMLAAFKAGELERDVVVVVRFQGPQANGMPELHKLTPPLAVLQGKGYKVALVTDGRMSGASGKVPAAIHVSPEALAGGPLARLRDGDRVRLDAVAGHLQALVPDAEWAARPCVELDPAQAEVNGHDLGRELFAGLRRNVKSAEEGAITWK
jgi:phosphogluconate dehydratase